MSEVRGKDTPPAVHIADPDGDLEKKLRRDPSNDDAKVDVGSDESMDASDPPASTRARATRSDSCCSKTKTSHA